MHCFGIFYFKVSASKQTLIAIQILVNNIEESQYLHCILSSPLSSVTVNVGRAGAASLDVIQEVEYVKQEAKVVYLLECLQKTPPPVSHLDNR